MSEVMRDDRPFATVYTAALRGTGCHVEWLDDDLTPLPVTEWRRTADGSDRVLLDHCLGDTLDLGCGPGRMGEYLVRRGHRVLGVDIVAEAAHQATSRGLETWVGDVFDPLPREGSWQTALLADGNIGIGGDPTALLRRVRELVAPGGRVVVDLRPPGRGVRHRWARIRTDHATSRPFRWALVSADAVAALAATAGFPGAAVRVHEGRWYAVLGDRR
ncbi:class I SAM-dependent DNA methyltransferase [Nocardioides coralli]|uniref:class I SAM-dependent DNA methyltransferase n=1 Tax=Nocardioides coralli TaxID=2872154 RepID=UPI001CA3EAAE|nr:class I SAM-dependent methyltransferase [Nocardioides coralli]QZY30424.1 class I SAM-dependent methyltransferase [Nocardioides coralli]